VEPKTLERGMLEKGLAEGVRKGMLERGGAEGVRKGDVRKVILV